MRDHTAEDSIVHFVTALGLPQAHGLVSRDPIRSVPSASEDTYVPASKYTCKFPGCSVWSTHGVQDGDSVWRLSGSATIIRPCSLTYVPMHTGSQTDDKDKFYVYCRPRTTVFFMLNVRRRWFQCFGAVGQPMYLLSGGDASNVSDLVVSFDVD